MPGKGIDIVDRKDLLTFKEMYRITRVLSELGVNKVRLTGGEPFVRKDFMQFLDSLQFNQNLEEINITTNGALIGRHIRELENSRVRSINLSIDSLRRDRFQQITRRDVFPEVMESLQLLLQSRMQLKLNVVVQAGVNTDELVDFVALTKDNDLSVRFIEEMPFNGVGLRNVSEPWNHKRILEEIKSSYDNIRPLPSKPSSTSVNYQVDGHLGSFGLIPAYTRTICGDCNRIRITATGIFKNCLFDNGVMSLRDFIRKGAGDEDLKELFISTVHKKPENGFIAEASRGGKDVSESMSTIGG